MILIFDIDGYRKIYLVYRLWQFSLSLSLPFFYRRTYTDDNGIRQDYTGSDRTCARIISIRQSAAVSVKYLRGMQQR